MKISKLDERLFKKAFNVCKRGMELDKLTIGLFEEKVYGDTDFDPDLALIALDSKNKAVGFIMGVVRKRKLENMGYVKLLAVLPEYRRKKIGTALYNRVEEKFIKEDVKKVRVSESYPNYYMPGIDPFYTEAICFFERNGFKKFSDCANLEADLIKQSFYTRTKEKKLKSEGIEIKRATNADYKEVMKWVKLNFNTSVGEVENTFKNKPVSLHIAKKNNRVIAFSVYDANNIGIGWFGPMGTSKSARGKGIGGILLKRCLLDIKKQGLKKAIIPWVGPIPFYMHYVNSKVKRVFWRYEKQLF